MLLSYKLFMFAVILLVKMVVCPECSLLCLSTNGFDLHLKFVHGIFTSHGYHSFSCGESDCYREFSNWKTYRGHLIDFHRVPVSSCDSDIYVSCMNEPPEKKGSVTNCL